MGKKEDIIKLSDMIPDGYNANSGTIMGRKLLNESFAEFGAGRSVLLDKNNNIIAGNKSTAAAMENGITDAVVVDTDGDTLVVVKRTDLDINTKKGREMAIADNAISKANVMWDKVVMGAIQEKWGCDVVEWGCPEVNFENDETYKPVLRPDTAKVVTTTADIERAAQKIDKQIEDKKLFKNLMDVCCPECGYKFQIRRYDE